MPCSPSASAGWLAACALCLAGAAGAQPISAHQVGEQALAMDGGFGYPIYPLGDAALCPKGSSHFYSYTNQFSVAGDMVFSCAFDPSNQNLTRIPVYDQSFTLVFLDAVTAAGLGGMGSWNFGNPQFSQLRRVIYAQKGMRIYELDPWNGTSRIYVDFGGSVVQKRNGSRVSANVMKDFKVGRHDEIIVELGATDGSLNPNSTCPNCFVLQGEGTFDPLTGTKLAHPVNDGEYAAWPKVPTGGFDETNLTQDSPARVFSTYNRRPVLGYALDFSDPVTFMHPVTFPAITLSGGGDPSKVKWSAHGHMGFFCGSNGRCYAAKALNDIIDDDGDGVPDRVGQIGTDVGGRWRSYQILTNTQTGQVELVWGKDNPENQLAADHYSRSRAKDVFFGSDTNHVTRYQVLYDGGTPVEVRGENVAKAASRASCGYWATPRVSSDGTGERALFDSMRTGNCISQVYVAVRGAVAEDAGSPPLDGGSTSDAGASSPDGGSAIDAGPPPRVDAVMEGGAAGDSGCGCSSFGGGFLAALLLGLAPVVSRRRTSR